MHNIKLSLSCGLSVKNCFWKRFCTCVKMYSSHVTSYNISIFAKTIKDLKTKIPYFYLRYQIIVFDKCINSCSNMLESLTFQHSKHGKDLVNMTYDGKRLKWVHDFDSLKKVIQDFVGSRGKWSSPGGGSILDNNLVGGLVLKFKT